MHWIYKLMAGVLTGIFFGLQVFSAHDAQAEPIIIKMAVDSPVGSASDKGARYFKELVEEKSHGKYRVDQFLGQTFGSPESVYQAMMMGNLQIILQTTSQLSSLEQSLQLFDCPGIFPDADSFDLIARGRAGEQLMKDMSNKRLTMLGLTVALPRPIMLRTPFKTLADLQGKKIRTTTGKMHIASIKALGMAAIPMPWPEVFTALQQGVIDGHDSSIISCAPQHMAEVSPFIMETNHIIFSEIIGASTKWWDSLSTEDRDMFISCVKDCIAMIQKTHDEVDKKNALQEVIKQGATVFQPTDEEKKIIFEKTKDIYKDFKSVKPEWIELIRTELKNAGKL